VRWRCARCGEEHVGLPLDWAFASPAYWDGGRSPDDYLSDDACVWTDDEDRRNRFVRGVLPIPVVDTGESFRYGLWSSLSEQSFDRFLELWDDPARTEEPPYFGWLSNALPGYPDTLNLPLDVVVEDVDLRPSLYLRDADHPLAREQREGITLERVREIAELNLHRDV
jgi:hypothetical protein